MLGLSWILVLSLFSGATNGCCGDEKGTRDTYYHGMLKNVERLKAVVRQQPTNQKAQENYRASIARDLDKLVAILKGEVKEKGGPPATPKKQDTPKPEDKSGTSKQAGPGGVARPSKEKPTADQLKARQEAIRRFLSRTPLKDPLAGKTLTGLPVELLLERTGRVMKRLESFGAALKKPKDAQLAELLYQLHCELASLGAKPKPPKTPVEDA